jgi:hypothetical protein
MNAGFANVNAAKSDQRAPLVKQIKRIANTTSDFLSKCRAEAHALNKPANTLADQIMACEILRNL